MKMTRTVLCFVMIFSCTEGFVVYAAEPQKKPADKNASSAVVPVPSAVKDNAPKEVQSHENLAKQSKEVIKQIEKEKSSYIYDPRGKRDPFRPPYMEEKALAVITEEEKMVLDGIRKYKLNTFKLTGILVKGKECIAMVKAPDGMIYIIRENSKIGPGGTVKKILKSKVIIEDENTIKESDDFGKIISRKEKKEVIMNLTSS